MTDSEKDQKESMLKKINEVQNNLLDILWNMVDNKIKRDIVEVKTDRKKDIDKYLEELKTIIDDDDDDDDVIISDTLSDLRKLIKETYEVLSTIEDMCNVK